MPQYAQLLTDLNCPSCDRWVSDFAWFQWGFCWGYDRSQYQMGDAIHWGRCSKGLVLPWVFFKEQDQIFGANIGDPQIQDLIVRDPYQFYWDENVPRRHCGSCDAVIEGAVVEIYGGIIKRARIYTAGEFDGAIDIYLVQPDRSLRPMVEWNDHAMGSVRPGS